MLTANQCNNICKVKLATYANINCLYLYVDTYTMFMLNSKTMTSKPMAIWNFKMHLSSKNMQKVKVDNLLGNAKINKIAWMYDQCNDF